MQLPIKAMQLPTKLNAIANQTQCF